MILMETKITKPSKGYSLETEVHEYLTRKAAQLTQERGRYVSASEVLNDIAKAAMKKDQPKA
jgi:hypothetical protein